MGSEQESEVEDQGVHTTTSSTGVRITPFKDESQLDEIMALIDSELSEPYTIYTYRYFIHQWPSLCFLAHTCHDSRPVGVVIGKLDRHLKGNRYMRGYIGMLSVDRPHRGRGIATQLLQTALTEMIKQGAQEIVLETEADNLAALQLYESLGFIRTKRLYHYYLNGKDSFRLALTIPEELWTPQEDGVSASTVSAMQSLDIL